MGSSSRPRKNRTVYANFSARARGARRTGRSRAVGRHGWGQRVARGGPRGVRLRRPAATMTKAQVRERAHVSACTVPAGDVTRAPSGVRTADVRRRQTCIQPFTPTYASWLNQIELWFSKSNATFWPEASSRLVPYFARKIRRYIRPYNEAAKTASLELSEPNPSH